MQISSPWFCNPMIPYPLADIVPPVASIQEPNLDDVPCEPLKPTAPTVMGIVDFGVTAIFAETMPPPFPPAPPIPIEKLEPARPPATPPAPAPTTRTRTSVIPSGTVKEWLPAERNCFSSDMGMRGTMVAITGSDHADQPRTAPLWRADTAMGV